ncbi:hypothetical protein YC2023_012315 [Brassica napus]
MEQLDGNDRWRNERPLTGATTARPSADRQRRSDWAKELTKQEVEFFLSIDFIDGTYWLPVLLQQTFSRLAFGVSRFGVAWGKNIRRMSFFLQQKLLCRSHILHKIFHFNIRLDDNPRPARIQTQGYYFLNDLKLIHRGDGTEVTNNKKSKYMVTLFRKSNFSIGENIL